MAQTAILGPFLATMLLTFVVWVYMYVKRIGFITRNQISPVDLAVPGALAQLSPAEVSNPSDDTIDVVMARSYLHLVASLALWLMLLRAVLAHVGAVGPA